MVHFYRWDSGMIAKLAEYDPKDLVYIGFFPIDEEELDRLFKVV